MSKIPYALSVGLTPTKNATILSVYSTPEPQTALHRDGTPYLAESGSTPSRSVLLLLVVNALSKQPRTNILFQTASFRLFCLMSKVQPLSFKEGVKGVSSRDGVCT